VNKLLRRGYLMVVSSEEYKRRRDDLETRISKMISEGGMAVEAHYFNDQSLADPQEESKKVEMAKKSMISEGGLGAAYYYNDTQEVHEVDIDEDDQLIN